jgi:fibronectin type 3 domain-containing protein
VRIRRLVLQLFLLTSALAQVQTTGTVTLTGSVQEIAGGKHSVTLKWNGATGEYITFRIYRSTSSGTSFQMIQEQIPGFSFTDVNVNNSTTYYYVATAFDSSTNSESRFSNQVVATIPN